MGAGCIRSLVQKFKTKMEVGFTNIPQLNYKIKTEVVYIK